MTPIGSADDVEGADRTLLEGLRVVTLNGRVTGVRDPDGTPEQWRRPAGWRTDQLSLRPAVLRRPDVTSVESPNAAQTARVSDGNAAIRRAEGASTHGCRPRHLSELGVDARHVAAQSVGDPDGVQSDAIPVGVRLSRGIVAVGVRSTGSIRVSVRSSRLPTQIEPSPAATGPGRIPTWSSATISSDAGSIRADVVRLYRAETAGGITSKREAPRAISAATSARTPTRAATAPAP